MTHDELLKSIEFGHEPLVFEALWKVARLHKPIFEDAYDWCVECEVDAYPCPTIQVIESVLPLVNLNPDMA
jgi:hypothetical protein